MCASMCGTQFQSFSCMACDGRYYHRAIMCHTIQTDTYVRLGWDKYSRMCHRLVTPNKQPVYVKIIFSTLSDLSNLFDLSDLHNISDLSWFSNLRTKKANDKKIPKLREMAETTKNGQNDQKMSKTAQNSQNDQIRPKTVDQNVSDWIATAGWLTLLSGLSVFLSNGMCLTARSVFGVTKLWRIRKYISYPCLTYVSVRIVWHGNHLFTHHWNFVSGNGCPSRTSLIPLCILCAVCTSLLFLFFNNLCIRFNAIDLLSVKWYWNSLEFLSCFLFLRFRKYHLLVIGYHKLFDVSPNAHPKTNYDAKHQVHEGIVRVDFGTKQLCVVVARKVSERMIRWTRWR